MRKYAKEFICVTLRASIFKIYVIIIKSWSKGSKIIRINYLKSYICHSSLCIS